MTKPQRPTEAHDQCLCLTFAAARNEPLQERGKMSRPHINRVIVAIAIAALPSAASAAGPTIYPLPVANNGSTAGRGYGINDSGQVAVTSTMLFGQGTAG